MDDDSESGPKHVRITSSGKIKSFVAFALDFFQKYDSRPLVFHTLPHDPPGQTTGDLHNVTLLIPRLISVVEIIKREFLTLLHEKRSERLVGLHQYNQLGALEDLGYGDSNPTQQSRDNQIAYALEGKNHIKLKQTPYLRITLSLERMPELEKNATYVGQAGYRVSFPPLNIRTRYQSPQRRKLSKSAKARVKKRERKSQGTAAATAEGSNNTVMS